MESALLLRFLSSRGTLIRYETLDISIGTRGNKRIYLVFEYHIKEAKLTVSQGQINGNQSVHSFKMINLVKYERGMLNSCAGTVK